MSYYPSSATGLNYITYPVGPTTGSAPVVTANASANTKGNYTQITASSGFTCNGVWVELYGGTSQDALLDLATGAAASEVVVIPNIMCSKDGATGDTFQKGTRFFPLAIAASTRIAARIQARTGSQSIRCGISLIAAGDVAGITPFVTYGAATADSGGTSVDPGATPDTKGAYSQITASTSALIQWLSFLVTTGGNTGTTAGSWYFDVATGAGGAEVVLIPDLPFGIGVAGGALQPKAMWFLSYIAASTRIAVRASSDNTDATDRLIDVSIIAGTAPSEASGVTAVLAGPTAMFVTPMMAGY